MASSSDGGRMPPYCHEQYKEKWLYMQKSKYAFNACMYLYVYSYVFFFQKDRVLDARPLMWALVCREYSEGDK